MEQLGKITKSKDMPQDTKAKIIHNLYSRMLTLLAPNFYFFVFNSSIKPVSWYVKKKKTKIKYYLLTSQFMSKMKYVDQILKTQLLHNISQVQYFLGSDS